MTVTGPAGGVAGDRAPTSTSTPVPVPASMSGGERGSLAALGFLLIGPLAVAWTVNGLFTGHGALAVLAGAVVGPAALVTLVSRRTTRLDVLAAVTVAGFAGYALATLFGPLSTHGPLDAAGFLAALREGWSSLLTTALPADPEAALLTLPVLLVWLMTSTAVALAASTRAALPPLVPVLLGFAAALALVTGQGGAHLPAAAALASSALGFTLVQAEATAVDGPAVGALRGRLLLGAPVLAIVVAAATAVAALAPSRAPADPRALTSPRVVTSQELNPLVEVRGQLTATPARRLGTIRLASSTGRLPVDRVTTAVLNDFDGARWRNTNVFLRVGRVPPAGDLAPVDPAVTVRAEVTLDAFGSPLLPLVGWPSRLGGAALAIDPDTGALLATEPTADGYRYQLTAAVAAPAEERLAAAVPGSGEELAGYLAVPTGLPADLATVATTATAGARTPYEQLTALERFLRDPARFPYDLDGRPGQSYGSLARMLTSPDPREQRGYAEQHASAFALLARISGFPSRIAVGYLLGPGAGQGVYEISQSRAHAWPEVYLDGIGWVPFEPTDTSDLDRRTTVDTALAPGDGPAPAEPDQARDEPPLPQVEPIPLLDQPASSGGGAVRSALLWALIALAALLALLPLLVAAEKRRRRWRRRAGGTSETRTTAAWQEARDRLWEWGVPADRSRTASEVVEDARALGDPVAETMERLAALFTATLFGAPAAGSAVTGPADGAADGAEGGPADERAWALVAELGRRLRAGCPPHRRLRAAVNPRPLLGRRGHARVRSGADSDFGPGAGARAAGRESFAGKGG